MYQQYPDFAEGFLTEMRSKLVNGNKLEELAKKMQIDQLIISKNLSNGHHKILEDTFEALIGAIYLDKGYKKTIQFVCNRVLDKAINLKEIEEQNLNYKSQLIEWGQKVKKTVRFKSEQDKSDTRVFVASVYFDNELICTRKGSSKKEAEQNAARETVHLLLHSF